MSENNNNGKKNFFKRLSGFKKFLVIYASVLVVIIAVALVLLYGLLKDYEAGRPANTMDKLVSHIEAGNVGKWIKDAGILGEFETEDIVSDYFNLRKYIIYTNSRKYICAVFRLAFCLTQVYNNNQKGGG